MKGKIVIIALLCLAMVFGMVLVSCDDGTFPMKSDNEGKNDVEWTNLN